MRTLVVSEFDAVTHQAQREISECHPAATFTVFRSIREAQKVSPFDHDLLIVSGFNGDGVKLAEQLTDRKPGLPVIGLNDICANGSPFNRPLTRNFTSLTTTPCHSTPMTGAHFGKIGVVADMAQRCAARAQPK